MISGEKSAQGDTGYATGKHGGIDHMMIWFSQEAFNKTVWRHGIQVKAPPSGFAAE